MSTKFFLRPDNMVNCSLQSGILSFGCAGYPCAMPRLHRGMRWQQAPGVCDAGTAAFLSGNLLSPLMREKDLKGPVFRNDQNDHAFDVFAD